MMIEISTRLDERPVASIRVDSKVRMNFQEVAVHYGSTRGLQNTFCTHSCTTLVLTTRESTSHNKELFFNMPNSTSIYIIINNEGVDCPVQNKA